MNQLRIAFCCVCLGIVLASTIRAEAADLEPGIIRVLVVDKATGKPVKAAAVHLDGGGGAVVGYTDDHGIFVYTDVPSQGYQIYVTCESFLASSRRDFDVLENQTVEVKIELAPIKVIGHVEAVSSSTTISSAAIGDDSEERRVSESLLSGLSKLAGVTVNDTPYGQGFSNGVSLLGHDQAATGYAVNGAPVGGISNVNLAQDLFTGGSVSLNPNLGYLGGFINYQTLRPTQSLQYSASGGVGGVGASDYTTSLTGTVGKLGIAAQYAGRGVNSFLDDSQYFDQSGLDYKHIGGVSRAGEALTLRYALDDRTSLTVNGIRADQRDEDICSLLLALYPCGYGPTNQTVQSYSSGTADLLSQFGNVQVDLFGTANASGTDVSNPQRTVFGTVIPYTSETAQTNRSYALSLFDESGRHSLSASYRVFASVGLYTTSVGSDVQSAQSSGVQSSLQLGDRIRLGSKVTGTVGLQQSSSDYAGGGTTLNTGLHWAPEQNDAYELAWSGGTSVPGIATRPVLSDPSTAVFDCANQSVLVQGPGDPVSAQTSSSVSASWRHDGRTWGFQTSVGDQDSRGTQRNLLVPLASVPSTSYPSSPATYLTTLEGYWSSALDCGSSVAFDPDRVYANELIGGLHQRIQYATMRGRWRIGRRVIAIPVFTFNRADLDSLDSRFLVPGSFYRDGAQIPGVPKYTAGLTVDGTQSRWFEWLINAQSVGLNNANNLPAYVQLNAGAVYKTRIGKLTLLFTNALNADAFRFTQYRGINPLALVGGGSIAFPSTPLLPSQWEVSFRPDLSRLVKAMKSTNAK